MFNLLNIRKDYILLGMPLKIALSVVDCSKLKFSTTYEIMLMVMIRKCLNTLYFGWLFSVFILTRALIAPEMVEMRVFWSLFGLLGVDD